MDSDISKATIVEKQLETLQGWLIGRIQHEDMLLMQRTYNFLTLNIFLGAILVLSYSNSGSLAIPGSGPAIALMGILLSCLQIALGRRIECASTFYHEYLWLLEARTGLGVDKPLFDYYKTARVSTPWGTVGFQGRNDRPIYRTFPWSVMPFSHNLVGILVPWMISAFWLWVLVAPLYREKHVILFSVCIGSFLVISVFTWVWPLPALPHAEGAVPACNPTPGADG